MGPGQFPGTRRDGAMGTAGRLFGAIVIPKACRVNDLKSAIAVTSGTHAFRSKWIFTRWNLSSLTTRPKPGASGTLHDPSLIV